MRICVRVGVIRCFSAPQKSICFSPSPPPQLLLERAAAAFPGPAARKAVRSGLPREAAVHLLFLVPLRLRVVLLLVRRTRARGRGGKGGTTIAFFGTMT